ncbi:MAG: imidazole glycerol phosphate synthase subunit HisH [Anaerolineae bacterium]
MREIAIIDAGIGNLRSVQKAFERVGARPLITGDPAVVVEADAVVLPGVGAFGDGMNGLRSRGLDEAVLDVIKRGVPFFGICVGLQLLFQESEEMGTHQGLGVLPGRILRFPANLTVPHMGWNQIEQRRQHPLLAGVPDGAFAYFAHSYHVVTDDESIVVATTDYGSPFPSVVARDHVWAIQFHPEKSQQVGLKLLANFVARITNQF